MRLRPSARVSFFVELYKPADKHIKKNHGMINLTFSCKTYFKLI